MVIVDIDIAMVLLKYNTCSHILQLFNIVVCLFCLYFVLFVCFISFMTYSLIPVNLLIGV